MFWIKVWWAKRAFMSVRADVYEIIISQLTDAGSRRIETLAETFAAWAKRDAERGQSVAAVYKAIEQRLRKGQPFSAALKGFVPDEERMLIDAGEASGRLADSFRAALSSQQADAEMRGAMAGAMLQPIFNFLGLVATSVALGAMLWPELMATFAEKYWPAWCLPLIKSNVWLANNWTVLTLLILLLPAYYYALPRWSGRSRQFADHMPPWSLYRDRNASRLLVIVAGLIRAGMTVDAALERVKKSSSPYMRWHLSVMIRRLQMYSNDPIKAFETGLFSRPILDRLGDAMRTQSPDEALSFMGDRSLQAIIKLVKRAAASANVVCMAIIGLLFAYSIAVQVIGAQEASSAFTTEMTSTGK